MSEAVYIGWWVVGLSGSELRRFGGDPAEVITKSVVAALNRLGELMTGR